MMEILKNQILNNSILELNSYSVLRDDQVCFNKKTGEVVTLNHTGFLLLKLLNGSRTVFEITNSISTAFVNDSIIVTNDALNFYSNMAMIDIIKIIKNE